MNKEYDYFCRVSLSYSIEFSAQWHDMSCMTDVWFTIKELDAFRLIEIILLNLLSVAKTFSARQIFPSLDLKIRTTCFSFLVGSIAFKQQSNFLIVLFYVNAVIISVLVCFHRNRNEAKLFIFIFFPMYFLTFISKFV